MWRCCCRGWTRAVDWIPCAIGALPSVSDPNGRLSVFGASQDQTVADCPSASSTQPHASPMAFAMQSAHPGQVPSQNAEAAAALTEIVLSQTEGQASDRAEGSFADYWHRFTDADSAIAEASVATDHQLITQGKTVRVL